MKKRFLRLVAVLLALAPMAFAAACGTGDNKSDDTSGIEDNLPADPSDGDNTGEEPSDGDNAEEEPSGGDNTEEEPSGGDNTTEEPSEGDNTTEEPSGGDNTEEEPTKPSLPGGLVDGGNFEGRV